MYNLQFTNLAPATSFGFVRSSRNLKIYNLQRLRARQVWPGKVAWTHGGLFKDDQLFLKSFVSVSTCLKSLGKWLTKMVTLSIDS